MNSFSVFRVGRVKNVVRLIFHIGCLVLSFTGTILALVMFTLVIFSLDI